MDSHNSIYTITFSTYRRSFVFWPPCGRRGIANTQTRAVGFNNRRLHREKNIQETCNRQQWLVPLNCATVNILFSFVSLFFFLAVSLYMYRSNLSSSTDSTLLRLKKFLHFPTTRKSSPSLSPFSFMIHSRWQGRPGVHDGNRNPNPTKESDYPDLIHYNIAYILLLLFGAFRGVAYNVVGKAQEILPEARLSIHHQLSEVSRNQNKQKWNWWLLRWYLLGKV
jgi:hypothetical protein